MRLGLEAALVRSCPASQPPAPRRAEEPHHPRPALCPQPVQPGAAGQAPGNPPQWPRAGLAPGEAPYLRRPCGRLPAGSQHGTRSGRGPGAPGTCACSRRSGPHTGFCLRPPPKKESQGERSGGRLGTLRAPGCPGPRPPCWSAGRAVLPAAARAQAAGLPPGPATLTDAALAVLLQLELGPALAAVLRHRELHAVVLAAAVAHGAGADGWGHREPRSAQDGRPRGPRSRRWRDLRATLSPSFPPPSQRPGFREGNAAYLVPGRPFSAHTQGLWGAARLWVL